MKKIHKEQLIRGSIFACTKKTEARARTPRRRPTNRRKDHREHHRLPHILLGPLEQLPYDPDVKALLRMAVVWNIYVACNRATADFMISSPLMNQEYQQIIPDYEHYRRRFKGRLVDE